MTSTFRARRKSQSTALVLDDLHSPEPANDTEEQLVSLGRALPKSAEELRALLRHLDQREPSDLRAAAFLVLVALGLRKREIVALDTTDLVNVGNIVCVKVRSRKRNKGAPPDLLPVLSAQARTLRAYRIFRRASSGDATPLFCSIQHGRRAEAKRITANAISYWLLELRLRARRASP
jgi:integrase